MIEIIQVSAVFLPLLSTALISDPKFTVNATDVGVFDWQGPLALTPEMAQCHPMPVAAARRGERRGNNGIHLESCIRMDPYAAYLLCLMKG